MVNLLVAEQLARDTIGALSDHGDKANHVVNMVNGLLTEVQPAFNKLVSSYVWARNVIVPTVGEFASIWGEMEYLDNDDSSENAGEAEYNAHFSLAFDTVNAFTHNTHVYNELCEQVDWQDEKLADAQSRAVGLLTAIENALATAQFMFKDAPETVKPVFNEAAQDVTAKIIECYNNHLEYSKSTKQMNDFVNQFREFPPEECRL
jgi:hypothetical protein